MDVVSFGNPYFNHKPIPITYIKTYGNGNSTVYISHPDFPTLDIKVRVVNKDPYLVLKVLVKEWHLKVG